MMLTLTFMLFLQEGDPDFHFDNNIPPDFTEGVSLGVLTEWVDGSEDIGLELDSAQRYGLLIESEIDRWISVEASVSSFEADLSSQRLQILLGDWKTRTVTAGLRGYVPMNWLPDGSVWLRWFGSGGLGWNFNHMRDNLVNADIIVRDAPLAYVTGGLALDLGAHLRLTGYLGWFHSQPLLITQDTAGSTHDRYRMDTIYGGGALEVRF